MVLLITVTLGTVGEEQIVERIAFHFDLVFELLGIFWMDVGAGVTIHVLMAPIFLFKVEGLEVQGVMLVEKRTNVQVLGWQ